MKRKIIFIIVGALVMLGIVVATWFWFFGGEKQAPGGFGFFDTAQDKSGGAGGSAPSFLIRSRADCLTLPAPGVSNRHGFRPVWYEAAPDRPTLDLSLHEDRFSHPGRELF